MPTEPATDVFDPTTLITRTPPLEAAPKPVEKTPEPAPSTTPEPDKAPEPVKEPEVIKELETPPDEPVDSTPDKYAQKQARKIAKLEATIETFSSSLEELKELIKSQGKPATVAQREALADATATQTQLESQLDALANGSETADYVGADATLAKELKAMQARLAAAEEKNSRRDKALEEIEADRFWIRETKQPGCDTLDCPKIYEKALEDTSVEEVTADLRRILRSEPTTAQITEEVEERASRLYYRRRDDAAKAQLAKAGKKPDEPAPRSTPKPAAPHLPSPTPDGGSVLQRTNGSRPIAAPTPNGNVLTDTELASLGRELKGMRRR